MSRRSRCSRWREIQDWLDVEGIIVRQGAALRRAQILEELSGLLELKEDEAPKASLEQLFGSTPGRLPKFPLSDLARAALQLRPQPHGLLLATTCRHVARLVDDGVRARAWSAGHFSGFE